MDLICGPMGTRSQRRVTLIMDQVFVLVTWPKVEIKLGLGGEKTHPGSVSGQSQDLVSGLDWFIY